MNKRITLLASLLISAPACADYYVAAKAGLLQGAFNQSYYDLSDTIPQDIAIDIQQYGYTGGLAVGYQQMMTPILFLGGELSGNLDMHEAVFATGASTAAFTDTIQIQSHADLTLVPGVMLSDTASAYLKVGLAYARVTDNLVSPSGVFANMTTTNSNNQSIFGFAVGLGFSKYINKQFAVFTEAVYRDFGNIDLPGFQNFTANYSHSVHVYATSFETGVAYHF